MQPLSPALQTLLASRRFYACQIFTITLVDGTTYRYSDGDCNIAANGFTYSCGGRTGPFFNRDGGTGQLQYALGTDVDQMVIEVVVGNATMKGMPILQAIEWGWLDGAWIEVEDAYLGLPIDATHWPLQAVGTAYVFSGQMAEIDIGDGVIVMTINSAAQILQAQQNQIPRKLYQPGCLNILGDAVCGVDVAATAVAGVVTAGSTAYEILSALPQADEWFDLGILTFTSGALQGLSRSVETWTAGNPGTFSLMTPFPDVPSPGDGFSVTRGCDQSLGPRGCPKLNSDPLKHYRAEPFVPPPSSAN